MLWQSPGGVDEYLKPTELCDCDNEELKRSAKEIIGDVETPKEAALKIFSFVRDGVLWKMDNIDVKASKTLKKRGGACVNKTNLQVALLRAVDIPARYHQANLKKEWLKPLISGFMFNRLPEIVWFHPWCECYLSERWIACEALFDEALYKAMLQEGVVTEEQVPTIDWDGENDLVVMTPWITEDVGKLASMDVESKRAQKEVTPPRILSLLFGWFFFLLSNRRTNGLRKKWKKPEAPKEEVAKEE